MTNLIPSEANNLVFIDTNLTDYQSLIPDTSNSEIILLDSGTNGIEQISAALENYSNLDSISIVSHGDAGLVQLGDTNLSGENLDSYAGDLAAWGDALSAEGDLLFYGCNVGANAEGFDFVNRVAKMTGADVAASDDLTGNTDLGGDWTLEVVTGKIETPTFELTEHGNLLDLRFNFTYDSNVTTAQKTAFEYAGKAWADKLSDDVTINLHVSMANSSDLPSNTLGGAIPFFHQATDFLQVRNKLNSDEKSSDDSIATNHLDDRDKDYYDVNIYNRSREGYYSTVSFEEVAMTRANAKAVGLINPHDNTLDGTIVMNNLSGTGVSWQYDYRTASVGHNKIDFTTVAIHEIGHALGFVSLVDGLTESNRRDDLLLGSSGTSLDLFRYSSETETRMIATRWSGFSIDGQNILADFSQGAEDVGTLNYAVDGYQGSHWRNQDNAGIMDPLLELGVRRGISNLDLRALDVIGWDRKSSSNSVSTLWSQAQSEASSTGNINRNTDVDEMLSDWRWARGGSSRRLTQTGNITQFLAQEGFFSVGAFRSSFDFSSVNATVEATSAVVLQQLSTAVDRFGIEVLDAIDTQLNKNSHDSDLEVGQNQNTGVINHNDLVSAIDEWLSDYQSSEASLDKLQDLLEQPQFLASLVETMD